VLPDSSVGEFSNSGYLIAGFNVKSSSFLKINKRRGNE
jgi:hypothetical protein